MGINNTTYMMDLMQAIMVQKYNITHLESQIILGLINRDEYSKISKDLNISLGYLSIKIRDLKNKTNSKNMRELLSLFWSLYSSCWSVFLIRLFIA